MSLEQNSFIEPFVPRRGLRGAHVQTLAAYFLRRLNTMPPSEARLFEVEQGARVLCRCNWQPDRRGALTAILVHGLDGSSESPHVLGLAMKAWAAGMNVVRMNMRNCGGTESFSPTLYHSGLFGDLAAIVRELISKDGLPGLVPVGFSMGANLVLNLAGNWSHAAPRELCAVAAVSPAMDLAPSADALHQGLNRIYERKFLRGLTRLYRRKAKLFPGRFESGRAAALRSIRDYDDRIIAPYNGFRDADDYYTRASSSNHVEKIAVPCLIVHSKDDPFIRIRPETRAKLIDNRFIRYLETDRGGHCAFLAEAHGYDGRWAERCVVEFLKQQAAGLLPQSV